MIATLERRLTEAEYLALERQSEVRHEFVNGRMLEMPGASLQHEKIILNIVVALNPAVQTRQCRAGFGGTQLRVPNGTIYYPDVMISCLEVSDTHIEREPCFLVEVLSPSTEARDRGRKFDDYTSMPSVTQYMLVSQEEPRVTVFTRGTDDWRVQSITSGVVNVQCLETSLTLEQMYAGVEFAPEEVGHAVEP